MNRAGWLALALAGCAASFSADAPPDDGGTGSGGAPGCAAVIDVAQPVPVAAPGATLHASAGVAAGSGMPESMWQVQFDGAPIDFSKSMDGTAIDVPVPDAGIYILRLEIPGCSSAIVPVNVEMPGARTQTVRLQIVPPLGVAVPPMEQLRDVKGGADIDLGAISVLSGRLLQAVVLGPTGGVPAYLQFSPGGASGAIVEAFSDASGVAAVQLVVPGPYTVLVVPSSSDLAPRRIPSWSPSVALLVDAGSTIKGTVMRPGVPGPADVPLAGATVRLVSDGVPSTVAITAADGSFALHAAPGGTLTIEVTPPAGSGLPRLSATSSGFNPAAPVQIRYADNLGQVDLAGTVVKRKGAAVAGARLTVVGSLTVAGMVTAGATAFASGEVRVAATADAAGALPQTLVPAGSLSAVIEVGPGDLAVTPLNTTGGSAPASLDAPPMLLIGTAVTAMIDGGAAGVPGALLDLVPTGALAMAAAPILRFTAGKAGVITAALPAGGSYELRLQDPQGRGAPLVVADRPVTAIALSYQLPTAIQIQGSLLRDGTLALSGASVQLMCTACTGLDAALPLAEVASDAAGRFTLAVPDPGTR